MAITILGELHHCLLVLTTATSTTRSRSALPDCRALKLPQCYYLPIAAFLFDNKVVGLRRIPEGGFVGLARKQGCPDHGRRERHRRVHGQAVRPTWRTWRTTRATLPAPPLAPPPTATAT
ncbi:unnamed protein product [Musa textilis]